MKYTTERKPGSIIELTITAEGDEFVKAVDDAITRQSRKVQIPGFRKGKAPRHMVERFYGGREVFQQDAAEKLMDSWYREAVEKEDLHIVGDPAVATMVFDPEFSFTVSVPTYPTIGLGDYTAVRQDPEDAALTDDDVDLVITRLLRQQAPWTDVTDGRHPAEGDQVTIDYTVKEGADDFQEPIEDAEWVLGETNLLPVLRERIESMSVGETESFDVVYEEDDQTADPIIRGKELSYTVTLKALKTKELGEVNDEFAQQAAGIATVDDLKEAIRHDVHKGKTDDARNKVLNAIVESISEGAEIDLPAVMIDEEVEHQLSHRKEDLKRQGIDWDQMLQASDMTEDDVKADTRPEAEKRLRNTMILQEIARQENIGVTDEDVDAEIERIAGKDLHPDESDTEAVERAGRLREVYQSDYFKNVLRNDLFEKQLTDRLIEIATEGKGAVLNGYDEPETPFEPKRWTPPTETAADAAEPAEPHAEVETEASEPQVKAAEVETEPLDRSAFGNAGDAKGEDNAPAKPVRRSSKLPTDGEGVDWISATDTDGIPAGFPIKGNANSKIYHTEESPSYEITQAEIYFANEETAQAHGYRAPKNMQK